MSEQKMSARHLKLGTVSLSHLAADVVDGNGKIVIGALPAAVFGGLTYKGSWNAATNTPAIPPALDANKGWYYIVGVSGTTAINGVSDWMAGDWIVSDGAAWTKSDNSENTELASTTAYDDTATGLSASNVQAAIVAVAGIAGSAQALAEYARLLGQVENYGTVPFVAASAIDLALLVPGYVRDGQTVVAGDKVLLLAEGDIYSVQNSGDPAELSLMPPAGSRSVTVLYGGSQSGVHLYQADGAGNTARFLHAPSNAGGIAYRAGGEAVSVEAKLLEMGLKSALTTTEKGTLVGAISEVRDDLDSFVADRWVDETPTGAVDGVNTLFVTTQAPALGTVPRLEIDGFRQRVPNNATWDASAHAFTFVTAPQAGEWVNVSYFKAV